MKGVSAEQEMEEKMKTIEGLKSNPTIAIETQVGIIPPFFLIRSVLFCMVLLTLNFYLTYHSAGFICTRRRLMISIMRSPPLSTISAWGRAKSIHLVSGLPKRLRLKRARNTCLTSTASGQFVSI